MLVACGVAAQPASGAAASNDEYALLVLANQSRVQASTALLPMTWHDNVAAAAQSHSDDMLENGCFQHASCGGESATKRIKRYYPGAYYIGENIISVHTDPRNMHAGWMASADHRANILSEAFGDFGAGISTWTDGWYFQAVATEDFAALAVRSASYPFPKLIAGAVLPRVADGQARELLVNFYDAGGAPQRIRALVGSSCVNLSLSAGTAKNGTYGVARSFTGNGCVPVVFEVIAADGTRARWPKDEAILVGVGTAGQACAERTTAVPTQDCGGGEPLPTPTPSPTAQPQPTPTPAGSATLGALRVSLNPGKAGAANGVVQAAAMFDAGDDFDPSASPASVRVRFETSGDWSVSVPAQCDLAPCFGANKRRTSFRAQVGQVTVSFVRAAAGRWKVRVSARNQPLSQPSAGAVQLTVTAAGTTFTGGASGELQGKTLVAD